MNKTPPPQLSDAQQDVQLAVDLIYLLESNDIEPAVALKALEMVKLDLEAKLSDTKLDSQP